MEIPSGDFEKHSEEVRFKVLVRVSTNQCIEEYTEEIIALRITTNKKL